MTRRRLLFIVVGLFAILVLGSGAVIAWLAATESGARLLFERVARAGDVTFATVAGRLTDEVVLNGLRVSAAGFEVEVDQVRGRIALADLLRGTLGIESLRLGYVRVRRAEQENTAALPADVAFSMPLGIELRRASIEGVSVERDDEPISLDRIILSATVVGQRVLIQRLETRWQEFFLSVQGDVDWSIPVSLHLLVSWSGRLNGQSWLGSVALDGDWPRLEVEQELLEPYAATATGDLLADQPAFDLVISSPDAGEVRLVGGFDAAESLWRAEVASEDLKPRAFAPGLPDLLGFSGVLSMRLGDGLAIAAEDIRFAATIGSETVTGELTASVDESRVVSVENVDLTLGENRARLAGQVGESLDVAVTAELNDVERLVALLDRYALFAWTGTDLPALLQGRVSTELALSGPVRSPDIAGNVRVDAASFAELPFTATLEFAPSPATTASRGLRIERLEATLGSSRLEASGLLETDFLASGDLADAALAIDVAAVLPDLAELMTVAARAEIDAITNADALLATLSGAGELTLDVGGNLARPELAGRLMLSSLSLGGREVSRAVVDAELGAFAGGSASFAVDVATDEISLALVAAGTITADGWSGSLSSMRVEAPFGGPWLLAGPAAISLGAGRAEIGETCLTNAAGELCASWRHGIGTDRLELRGSAFDLGILNPLLPPTLAVSGRVAFDGSFDSAGNAPVGALTATGRNIAIGVEIGNGEGSTTLLESVSIAASLEGFALTLDAAIEGALSGRAGLSLSIADLRDTDSSVDGRLEIEWPDLAAVALLSPDVGEVDGTLEISIDVAGSMQSPELGGRAALSDGRVSVPQWGVLIDGIEASATSFDGGTVQFDGAGFIDAAEIRLSGVTELDPAAGWPTRLRVEGDTLPIAQRPDATVYASPSLEVAILLPSIEVSGSVLIPSAGISVEELPPQAVTISPDSVVHGELEDEVTRPLEVTAEVAVMLGDDVRYQGSGLDATLSGGLNLSYRSGVSPVANGIVSLAGSYLAYGQTLTLERGELLFSGSLANPAIDVLAIREIGSTTVGVRLTGTLESPTPSMFSDPPMSEANALSYLMLGRPLSATNDAEAATLESTALALGLQQALPAVQRVGETLGLDELSIEANDIDAGALMAGKYLSPKLYMSYSYGLFNRLGGFLLRYSINDRFKLETRSGSERSMDLLFSIEKE